MVNFLISKVGCWKARTAEKKIDFIHKYLAMGTEFINVKLYKGYDSRRVVTLEVSLYVYRLWEFGEHHSKTTR